MARGIPRGAPAINGASGHYRNSSVSLMKFSSRSHWSLVFLPRFGAWHYPKAICFQLRMPRLRPSTMSAQAIQFVSWRPRKSSRFGAREKRRQKEKCQVLTGYFYDFPWFSLGSWHRTNQSLGHTQTHGLSIVMVTEAPRKIAIVGETDEQLLDLILHPPMKPLLAGTTARFKSGQLKNDYLN